MLFEISASHHSSFLTLGLRWNWCSSLSASFQSYSQNSWNPALTALLEKNTTLLKAFGGFSPHNTPSKSTLAEAIDDTPPSSFIAKISQDLRTFELDLMALFIKHKDLPQWKTLLHETSALWGRTLGLRQRKYFINTETPKRTPHLNGIFEFLRAIQHPHEMVLKPQLIRRYLADELEYETRVCAHQETGKDIEAISDLHCELESFMISGILEAIVPAAQYSRNRLSSTCIDRISL